MTSLKTSFSLSSSIIGLQQTRCLRHGDCFDFKLAKGFDQSDVHPSEAKLWEIQPRSEKKNICSLEYVAELSSQSTRLEPKYSVLHLIIYHVTSHQTFHGDNIWTVSSRASLSTLLLLLLAASERAAL